MKISLCSFDLKLEPQPGSDIWKCAEDSVRIARLLNVNVEFVFNEVRCLAVPQGDASIMVRQYRACQKKGTNFAHSVE